MRLSILAVALAAPTLACAQAPMSQPPTSQTSMPQSSMPQTGQPTPLTPLPAPPLPKAADFVNKAAQSDQFEIITGRLAATKADSPDLRAFGAMMVKDHTDSTAALRTAARVPAATPPQPLDPDQQAMLKELEAQVGKAFDTTYLTQQLTAHQEALALHTTYARAGDNAPLRAVAAKLAPTVRMHLAMLEKMRAADQTQPADPRR